MPHSAAIPQGPRTTGLTQQQEQRGFQVDTVEAQEIILEAFHTMAEHSRDPWVQVAAGHAYQRLRAEVDENGEPFPGVGEPV